ncbi:hypothetical protein KIN20_014100 [Parelaphostrongylus tenuis]|uniref:Uncharacterized protein n=1 Tax=Parelaphostrongylus tenuis TaxID=148309 RepID=A0AAD5MGL3_PARTN|nr:hypothetical protein KIN20_014100 [Parelaphostrongylus tenuis]
MGLLPHKASLHRVLSSVHYNVPPTDEENTKGVSNFSVHSALQRPPYRVVP